MKQSKAFQEWYGSSQPESAEVPVWVFEVPNLKTEWDTIHDPSPIKRCLVTSTGEDHFFIAYRNHYTRRTQIWLDDAPRVTLDTQGVYLHGKGIKGTVFVSTCQEDAEAKYGEIVADRMRRRERRILERELQSSATALKQLLHEEALKYAGISPFSEIRGARDLPVEDLERHRAGLDAFRARLEKLFADL